MKLKNYLQLCLSLVTTAAVTMGAFYVNDALNARSEKLQSVFRSSKLDPVDYGSDPAQETLLPIVRLSNKKDKGFCSGVVISKNYVLTAGHCLAGKVTIFGNGEEININGLNKADNEYNSEITITGQVASYLLYAGIDLGLVKGDFSKFQKVSADFNMPRQIRIPQNPMELMMMALAGINPTAVTACGFPGGNKHAICARIPKTQLSGFKTIGIGNIIPGMSGGPVLDNDGNLVGVNQAQSLEGSVAHFSNLVGALGFLGLE